MKRGEENEKRIIDYLGLWGNSELKTKVIAKSEIGATIDAYDEDHIYEIKFPLSHNYPANDDAKSYVFSRGYQWQMLAQEEVHGLPCRLYVAFALDDGSFHYCDYSILESDRPAMISKMEEEIIRAEVDIEKIIQSFSLDNPEMALVEKGEVIVDPLFDPLEKILGNMEEEILEARDIALLSDNFINFAETIALVKGSMMNFSDDLKALNNKIDEKKKPIVDLIDTCIEEIFEKLNGTRVPNMRHTKGRVSFEVVDEAKIPSEYKRPDRVAINKALTAGVDIPGVEKIIGPETKTIVAKR